LILPGKLHFSVAPADVPRAWGIIVPLFVGLGLDIGLKARTDFEHWPPSQRGREVTVYIYRGSDAFEVGGPMAGLSPPGELHEHWLGQEFELPGAVFLALARAAEAALAAAGIASYGGVADGDRALLPGTSAYCSLRNGAYVPQANEAQLVYPPNAAGGTQPGTPAPCR
jgi:hypothetical protein